MDFIVVSPVFLQGLGFSPLRGSDTCLPVILIEPSRDTEFALISWISLKTCTDEGVVDRDFISYLCTSVEPTGIVRGCQTKSY